MRDGQAYLTKKLRERDLGRDLQGSKITLNDEAVARVAAMLFGAT